MIADYAYIAGFIDADGVIGIRHQKRGKNRNKIDYHLQPYIQINNTNPIVIDWIKMMLDKEGIKTEWRVRKDKRKDTYKNLYELRINNHLGVVHLIKLIEPYLIVKAPAAKLVRQYITMRMQKNKKKYNAPYSEDDYEMFRKIRTCSIRGDCTIRN